MMILLLTCSLIALTAAANNDQQQRNSIRSLPLIPYHVHRRRLNLDSRDLAASPAIVEGRSSPLYQGLGTHYVDLWIGTPSQRQTVIIDTGSGITAMPCSGCSDCGSGYHEDNFFMEEDSSTFSVLSCDNCSRSSHCISGLNTCQLSVSYQEGSSWSAHEVSDKIYIGGPHEAPLDHPPNDAFNLLFGCQTSITGLFKTQLADGIMGMNFDTLSFWKQAHDSGAIPNQAFSLCFTKGDGLDIGAGVMTLGGNNPALHTDSNMAFANFVNGGSFFRVQIKKVYLRSNGGTSVIASSENATVEQLDIDQSLLMGLDVIVDSGTTSTYLARSLSAPFKAAWKEFTGHDWNSDEHLSSLTIEQASALPTILIQLHAWQGGEQNPAAEGVAASVDPSNPNDVLVAIPPSHYLTLSEGTFRTAIFFEGGYRSVLGANFMMGHDIYFDIDNTRMGFAESTCDYSTVSEAETSG